jgi:glycosyltransferase involved in cell wall biosynthesis
VEDAGAVGIFIAGITRSKLVFEKHSDPSSYKKGAFRNLIMWIYSKVEGLMVRHADACIGTGPGLVDQIKTMKPRGTVHHIFDIPSSLVEPTPSKVAEIRKKLIQKESEVLVGFVGSFAVYQGIELMFESIPEVVKKAAGVRFVIIGGTPEEIEQRKCWLAEKQVESAVTFTGKIPPDDLPDYLAALDILLSPRQAGVNTPLKILDYMKAGGAIVAHDTEANRLLLDSTTAVLVKPEPAAFSEGIVALVKDAALRDRLGKAGRKLIDETYNYGEFKRRLGVCYEAFNENNR